jgi:hypothetical protein
MSFLEAQIGFSPISKLDEYSFSYKEQMFSERSKQSRNAHEHSYNLLIKDSIE